MNDFDIIAKLVTAIRRDLETVVKPEALSPVASATVDMTSELLGHIGVWLDELHTMVPELAEANLKLVGEISTDEVTSSKPNSRLSPDTPFAGPEYQAAVNRLDALLDRETAEGDAVLPTVMSAEVRLRDQEKSLVEAKLKKSTDDLVACEPEPGIKDIEAIASDYLSGGSVSELAKIPGGYSKDTYRFTLEGEDRQIQKLVLRRNLPFNHAGTSVLDEYKYLKAVYAEGLPVAEPLLCVADKRYVGQPFVVSRFLGGSSGTDHWQDDKRCREEICMQLAHTLGRLHQLDPNTLGFEPLNDPVAQVVKYITDWRDHWHEYRIHASPTLAAGFQWLLENAPVNLERATIVHADVGFHNIMTEDSKILGLLDWEFAHLGDPAEDLAYCRQFVEPLMDWEDFMAEYRTISDCDYSLDRARFFEVWRSVRNSVSCAVAWHGFLTDKYPALKMALQGVTLYRRFLRDAAQQIKGELE